MDMNQLFYHHQRAVIAADQAHRKGEARARFGLPNHYARRINQFRAKRGLEPDFVGYNSVHARQPVPMIKTGSGAIALDIAQHRAVNTDGEIVTATPAHCRVVPRAIAVLAPRELSRGPHGVPLYHR